MRYHTPKTTFADRHISPDQEEIQAMLEALNLNSLEELIAKTVPENIREAKPLNLPPEETEYDYIRDIRETASKNRVFRSYIGMGYHPTIIPPVIQRNILENPGWYTAYTPYQAEIAQGRLEMLINFQTTVTELTAMDIANASLLDESTALAESVLMAYAQRPKKTKKQADTVLVSENIHPQSLAVLETRISPKNLKLAFIGEQSQAELSQDEVFALILQYPGSDGRLEDYRQLAQSAADEQVQVLVATDLLALTLLSPPGEWGADIVVGSAQRFGVPMGYGGPHAAFLACRETYKRSLPGRIIGVSKDIHGDTAYRMALQTREQHIRREKATSNICTAQVLLAVMSGAYAVYHGPEGLKNIARAVHEKTAQLKDWLAEAGIPAIHDRFFDTLKLKPEDVHSLSLAAEGAEINLRFFADEEHVGVSLDEVATEEDVKHLARVIIESQGNEPPEELHWGSPQNHLPADQQRSSPFLQQEVFNKHHAEHEMLRYLKRLENKDISLVHSMIPLGSCTMKLNATTEMLSITWPEFADIHPFAPTSQTLGYQQIFNDLEKWLGEITGFDAVSLQPNSGAQGEFTGLMVIRALHRDRGEDQRVVTLIPDSAHGTNPASAVMAGMKVVVIKCDEEGNIDLDDLRAKAEKHSNQLAALMVTYPSTHGVFEASIQEICSIIHQHGGRVYMDGANMNAQVGITSPANIGADVCHLNLHKTFCIPHGGGGPGMGPIGCTSELAPYLPGSPVIRSGGEKHIPAISAAPYGSASILPISHAYIRMMGPDGLKKATEVAILNANYIAKRLEGHYHILYKGQNGYNAHEAIVDFRPFKEIGVDVGDVARRLMDFGFHAPTVSFPVPGTMMIEPTESESKEEIDRFCEALLAIREEIRAVEVGTYAPENNPIYNAPHTAEVLTADQWSYPYSRQVAAYPLDWVRQNKFWPSVGKIDAAYGDRNLVCTCPDISTYQEEEATEVVQG